MKITVVHGQSHEGSTWKLTRLLLEELEKLGGSITEIRLPDQAPHFCTGCTACFTKGEDHCPHAAVMLPVACALDDADILVLTSPNYVMNMSGQMKTLLDHLAYRWMPHRPSPTMFSKQAVVVSTAAGAGAGKVGRMLKTNLRYWGVPRIFGLTLNVRAESFDHISPGRREKLADKAQRLALCLALNVNGVHPGLVTRALFLIMRQMHKDGQGLESDRSHWENLGWLQKERPWK